jgi:serine/threonine protein phosphatase PrpC
MEPDNAQSNRAWQGAGLTDLGRVRTSNQDAFAVLDRLRMWIVADGMSGYGGGEIASRVAVTTLTAFFEDGRAEKGGADDRKALLRQGIEAAHQAIRSQARERAELRRMGTTVVVAMLTPGPPDVATVAHVGDSRAYLVRGQTLTQLTQDHTVVREYVRRGLLSEEEALTHPERHVLMRALGVSGQAEPDVSLHELREGDQILLCTDGLTTMLADREILDTMLHCPSAAEAVCRALIDAANRRGGRDNITVVLVRRRA